MSLRNENMKKSLKILSNIFMFGYNPFSTGLAIFVCLNGCWYLAFPILALTCFFLWFYFYTHAVEFNEFSTKWEEFNRTHTKVSSSYYSETWRNNETGELVVIST